jgi:hypothetical protein
MLNESVLHGWTTRLNESVIHVLDLHHHKHPMQIPSGLLVVRHFFLLYFWTIGPEDRAYLTYADADYNA